jgi:D-sedoheptulose 7-phosphate isomerase
MIDYIKNHIKESKEIKDRLLQDNSLLETINNISHKMIDVYRKGNKVLIAGNGGSAADSQHIAGELVSRFYFDRPGLASIALTTDSSILTAIGNDYGYEKLFSRQIEANGVDGDLFIGISTSGNSKNIINALTTSKSSGIVTVGFTGSRGGIMEEFCDYCIKIPSIETPRIQEAHILIGHILCAIVEKELFEDTYNNQ